MTLLSLPNELLLDVFSHFEDPHLLFTLSTLCKRLHLLALPLYLSQIGVYESLSPGVCNITIGQHRTEALAALQTALFLDAVQTLSCTLPHAMQLGQDVKRLARVCAALTSVNSATLHVNPRKFLDDSSGDLNPLSFVDCLNSLLEKSCSSLTVKSFRDRWTDHKSRPMRRAQQPSRVLSAAALSPAAMRAKSLSTFNIHSEILVFPHVRAWTIDVLNSFPIRALSISAPFQIEEITDILAVTEIPTLLTLALHESRITPAQLHAFLARHPQITHLRLEKLIVPPLHERLPSRALESIVTLTAGPTHVAYLLHALNRLPSTLQCIRILSYMTTVDLQGANSSLHHVVSFLAGIPDLRLVLPVPDSLPRTAPDTGLCFPDAESALHFVSRLELGFHECITPIPLLKLQDYIGKWCEPFPLLSKVDLVGLRANDRYSAVDIATAVRSAAPQVETFFKDGQPKLSSGESF